MSLRNAIEILCLAVFCLFAAELWADEPAAGDQQARFYKERIEPVLSKSCFECHSHASGESSGNLMLDSASGMTGGGTRGAAVVPGKPDESWLLKAMTYKDNDLQMPPDGKLPDNVIEDVRKWIADGAQGAPAGSGVSASGIKRLLPDEAEAHWAYRLPERATVPSAAQLFALATSAGLEADQAQAAIARFHQEKSDALILAAQFAAGVTPSEPADRSTLARRLVYDMTGLPPTANDVEAFVNDPRPTEVAYTALVDRLLASPHFGERFARYWMDVARYADTKGYVFREEREYPQAYKYRDWLIAAFNSDLPYTDFVREQLAADKFSRQIRSEERAR
jgi:hypothetical protein